MAHHDTPDNWRYGIEYEFPLINAQHQFVDFANTPYEDLATLVEEMPRYDSDYPELRIGDLGIKEKRWYIEGFERFDGQGRYLRTDIKGMEIRTPVSPSIDEAVHHLLTDLAIFKRVAVRRGYQLIGTGFNPFQTEFVPKPPLNAWEIAHRSSPEEQTAYIHMLTYGPDVSLSCRELSTDQVIDAVRKLTYYSPFIVPFSFSSPFYQNRPWGGLSRRTYYRTGARPAALAFLADKADLVVSSPTLTEPARVPAEAGRIEFKAFDSVADPRLFGALLALVKGIVLDKELTQRATVPDTALHQLSAQHGFKDDTIYQQAEVILRGAGQQLDEAEQRMLRPLEQQLAARQSPADEMLVYYEKTPDIIKLLEEHYGTAL